MKRCISNIAWAPDKNEEVVSLLKKYGIQHIEIAPKILFDDPTMVSDDNLLTVKQYWYQKGIQLYGMQALLYGNPDLKLFETSTARNNMFDYLKSIVELAGRLNIKRMVFGSPKNRFVENISFDRAFDIATKFFFEIAEICSQNDVILCLEPNAKGYGCNFVNNTEEALKLIYAVDHDNFGLNMDTSTLIMNGENFEESISLAQKNIAHFHISAPHLGPVSDTDVNFKLISNLLKKIEYDEAVSIEMRPTTVSNIETTLQLLERHFA